MPSPRRCPDGHSRRGLLAGAAALVSAAWLLPTGAARADVTGARNFIQDVGDRTLAILNQKQKSDAEKLPELIGLLNESTDLTLVARLVLGQYWRTASEPQRQQYADLFRQLIVNTMAYNLSGYGGETFTITGARAIDERDSVISTKIIRDATGKPSIAVDWRIREADGRYLIVDIVAEGVSMVVTQRSEVGSVVSQKGMDGLIQSMKDKLAQPRPA
ncbi:MAG: ABC transporter substrate-binding protein [Geminicoccaceae bacterium]